MDKNARLDEIFAYILNNTNVENDMHNLQEAHDFNEIHNSIEEKCNTFSNDDQKSSTFISENSNNKRPSNGDTSIGTPTTKYSNTINDKGQNSGMERLTGISEFSDPATNINDFYHQVFSNFSHLQHLADRDTKNISQGNDFFQPLEDTAQVNQNQLVNSSSIMQSKLFEENILKELLPSSPQATDNTKNNSNYHNHLTEIAIESLKRQRNQSKLIHLDSVPDFQDSKDVKIWLQKIFYPLGIEIAIERSDKSKITYKCKALKKKDEVYQNNHVHTPVNEAKDSGEMGKKKRVKSQYNTCPFRIRASYKIKRKKWEVVILNNFHSHQLKFNPDSLNYKQFKDTLREMGDIETIKKFDELEYKAQKNLPVDVDTIPCECGLTEEVQSFGVVIPSSFNCQSKPQNSSVKKFAQKKSNSENPKLSKEVLTKNLPISKVKKQSSKSVSTIHSNALENLTRDSSIEKESNNSNAFEEWENENQVLLSSGHGTVESSIMGLNSLQANRSPEIKASSMFDFNMDINEVDFTDLFLKPSKKMDGHVAKTSSENLVEESISKNNDITKDLNDLKLFDLGSNGHYM
ncbi:uncharacterized protein HGUI_02859 [Hanseniaspora guilliermondii]|uniref:Uncharacterized protein n=1 Tax=Hanseniaspora guilliermondii TaxID=56406 RepID=A0A1L0B6G1_9ASCO|nr:uncharacterized protein HGUI_02859 [Hanseniaspora guilliermondii]